MADDGYLIGFEDSSGNFVEVGRFNNLSGNTSDPVFIEHTGSGTRMELDGSGFDMNGNDITNAGSVSTDQLAVNELAAKAIKNTLQPISSGGSSKQIKFDTVSFEDTDLATVDTTNNEIVVNRSGTYQINAGVSFKNDLSDGTRVSLIIRANGNAKARDDIAIGALVPVKMTCSVTERLSSGDGISCDVFQDSGSSIDLASSNRNFLSVAYYG